MGERPGENPADLADLYRETVRAHAQAPRGRDAAIDATHRAERDNPLCGDRVEILLEIEDGLVRRAVFRGEGCAICLASASLLCTHLPGEPASAVPAQLKAFTAALGRAGEGTGETADETPADLPGKHGAACPPALVPLLPVAAWPARIDCATLPWEAAAEALADSPD